MDYYFNKLFMLSFEDAISRVTDELKKEGFGILTDIDVQATLKKKMDLYFRKYRILGACNPFVNIVFLLYDFPWLLENHLFNTSRIFLRSFAGETGFSI